ncbi:MAG: trigger factor [Mycoplasmataceae bacterium]|nr:trigger factor [Mycoplasmataceae bacterium]
MSVFKREIKNNEVIYSVTTTKELWEKSQKDAHENLAKKVEVKGFRKGHAPKNLTEAQINHNELFDNAINLVGQHYHQLLIKNKEFIDDNVVHNSLRIDVVPESLKSLPTILFIVDKFPEVNMPDYKNIKLTAKNEKVTDDMINHQLKQLIKNDIMLIPKEPAVIANGDMVVLDFTGKIDNKEFPGGQAKDYELEIGSHLFIPGFEEQLIGLKKGDAKTINVKFPDDYHQPEFKGKASTFDVVIKDVKTINPPALDEQYVSKLKIPNVKNENELRNHIRLQTQQRLNEMVREQNTNQIVEFFIKNAKLSHYPQSLLQYEKNVIVADIENKAKQQNITVEDYWKQYLGVTEKEKQDAFLLEQAKNTLIITCVLDKIVKDEKIEVVEKDIEQHLQEMADHYQMKVEDIKKLLNNDFSKLREFLLNKKTFDKLISLNQK